MLVGMKSEIHPKYFPSSQIKCACGNVLTVGSTKEKMEVEVCSACHPFFTGKAKGLERVQKSAFLGKLPINRIDELALQCGEIIDAKTDSVYLFPLCSDDFRRVKTLGLAFDPRYVNDEVISAFF